MFMLNSNEPIKVAHLKELANQSMFEGALVTEMVNNSFSESKLNFDGLIKRRTFWFKKNIEIWAIFIRFCEISKLLRRVKEQQSC